MCGQGKTLHFCQALHYVDILAGLRTTVLDPHFYSKGKGNEASIEPTFIFLVQD